MQRTGLAQRSGDDEQGPDRDHAGAREPGERLARIEHAEQEQQHDRAQHENVGAEPLLDEADDHQPDDRDRDPALGAQGWRA